MNCFFRFEKPLIEAIAISIYRLEKCLERVDMNYFEFDAGQGCRTPHKILLHLLEVTNYGLSILNAKHKSNQGPIFVQVLSNLKALQQSLIQKGREFMPNYIIAYHGGKKPESPEEGAKGMKKWQAWIDGLGNAVVNPGTPLDMSKTVSSSGISDTSGLDRLTGFSIVNPDNMDAALEMARACPFLEVGTIEVAEVMKM